MHTFQSTLSVRRATQFHVRRFDPFHQFQSTLSVRRATSGNGLTFYGDQFQSTLSVRRATAQ